MFGPANQIIAILSLRADWVGQSNVRILGLRVLMGRPEESKRGISRTHTLPPTKHKPEFDLILMRRQAERRHCENGRSGEANDAVLCYFATLRSVRKMLEPQPVYRLHKSLRNYVEAEIRAR